MTTIATLPAPAHRYADTQRYGYHGRPTPYNPYRRVGPRGLRNVAGVAGLGVDTSTSGYINQAIGYGGAAAGQLSQGTGMQQILMGSTQIVGATVAAAAAANVGWATAAIPIVGPIIAGVTVGLMAIFARKGPKQKVATTAVVDKVEPLLQQNVDAYLALPMHYASAQAQALANFDAGWKWVVERCAIPEMGNPGQWCVNDRQSGACKWRDSAGECWNWFKGYRDPIANDPNVVPDPDTAGGGTGGAGGGLNQIFSGSIGGLPMPLLLAGGALVLALSMGDK